MSTHSYTCSSYMATCTYIIQANNFAKDLSFNYWLLIDVQFTNVILSIHSPDMFPAKLSS